MTLFGPRRKSGAFWKKRPLVKNPRKHNRRKTGKSRAYAHLPGILMPNVLTTTLKYARQIEFIVINPTSQLSLAIGGSNLNPVGQNQLQGTFPVESVGVQTIAAGDALWTGINGYSLWYEKMNIMSNEITLKVWADSTGGASTNANLQCALCAYAFRATTPPELDVELIQNVIAQKGTQVKMISGSGGSNSCIFKQKKSTSTMLGMINVTDDFNTSCGLQEQLFVNGVSPLSNPNQQAQWYYYFVVRNPNNIACQFTYSINMKANVRFSQRRFAQPTLAQTSSPPALRLIYDGK